MKWVIGIVVVAALGVVAWQSGWLGNLSQPNAQQQTSTVANSTQTASATSSLPTAQNDTSNTAMAQDAAAIDVQMQNLATDSSLLNQSLSDKPLQQSY